MKIRQATFALRVVRRRAGDAAIPYRRRLTPTGQERLDRIAQLGPLGFSAGTSLLRTAVRSNGGTSAKLSTGPFHPLDADRGREWRAMAWSQRASATPNGCTGPQPTSTTPMRRRQPGGWGL